MQNKLTQTFSRLAIKLRNAFPPAQFGVLMRRPGGWSGHIGAPDYGYLHIKAERVSKDNYRVSEQPLTRLCIMGNVSWQSRGAANVISSDLNLADAMRQVHKRQTAYEAVRDENGHKVWRLRHNNGGMHAIGKQYGVELAAAATTRKSLNEIKEVLA